MRDIDDLIGEHCDRYLPAEPAWVRMLGRKFPAIADRLDRGRSMRKEIEGHLRDSYESCLSKGQDAERAWQFSLDSFGDFAVLSQEIRRARALSYKCLSIRFAAMLALILLPLGKLAQLQLRQFIHVPSLGLMAATAAVGCLMTRRRDMDSLRRYALYGSWFGLLYGVFEVLIVQKEACYMGAPIAMILLSTFFGLFLAAPASRGFPAVSMMALCEVGVLFSLKRVGLLFLQPLIFDANFVKTVAAFTAVSLFFGLTVFDIRKLRRRLPALAAFGMVFACIRVLSSLHRSDACLFYFMFATAIPPMTAVLIALPLHRLQERLLQRAN